MMMLLHGAGDLGALGLPLPLMLLLSAAAVPALAGLLSIRAEGLASRPPPRYVLLPRWIRITVDSPVVRIGARAVVLACLAGVIVIAAAGPDGMTGNAAPRLTLVVLWGGTVAASVALGPVWSVVSPFRSLAVGLLRIVDPEERAVRPLPTRWGVWPAVGALAVWAWVAEAVPTPRAVLYLLIGYTAYQVAAGVWFGPSWFARGEALEAVSTLVGRLAPVGRDGRGRLALRNPLPALGGFEPRPGTRGLIAVMLAWELTHAARGTEQWPRLLALIDLRRGIGASTLALVAAIAVAAVAVRGATPRPFLVSASVPLLAGWVLAHHIGPALVDWRAAVADLADPLGRGWALHDIAGPPVQPVAPGFVALAQLVLLLAGVLASVVAAHRMAVARYDLRAARAVQFPLRSLLMVAVLGALALQAAAAA